MPVRYITDSNRCYIEREREDGKTSLTILTPRRRGLEERLRHAVSTPSPGQRHPASAPHSRSPPHATDSNINSLGKEPWATPSSQIGRMSPNSEVNRTGNASRERRRGPTQEDAVHSTEATQTFHTSRTFWTRLTTSATSNQITTSTRHQVQEHSQGRSPRVSPPHRADNATVPTTRTQRSPAPSSGAWRYPHPEMSFTSTRSSTFTLGSSPSLRSPPPSQPSPSNYCTMSSARNSIELQRLRSASPSPLPCEEGYSLLSSPSQDQGLPPSPSPLSYRLSRSPSPSPPPFSSDMSSSQASAILPRLLVPGSPIPESPLSRLLIPGTLDSEPEPSAPFFSKTPSNFWCSSRTHRSTGATVPSPSSSPAPAPPTSPSSPPLHASSSATRASAWIATLCEGYDILAARNDALAAELGRLSAELTALRATVNTLRPPRDVIKSALALLVRLFVVLVGGRAVVLRLIFIRRQRATDTNEADTEAS